MLVGVVSARPTPHAPEGCEMRLSRLAVVLVLALAAACVVSTAGAFARGSAPAAKIAAVRKQVLHIKRSNFKTSGKRAVALRRLSRAASAARHTRGCNPLRALDKAFDVLNAPTTWKRRRIPAVLTRRGGILSRLRSVERRLARAKKCKAKVSQTVRPLPPHKGGGKFTPI